MTSLMQRARRLVFRLFGRTLPRPRSQRALSRDQVHEYWKAPPDATNAPERYAADLGRRRSEFLTGIAMKYMDLDATVLELGCNAGRNLDHLYRAGFRNLTAVEISQRAIDVFRATYPDAAGATSIHVGALEEGLPEFGDSQFDFVFTMAVLEHVHDASEAVFTDIARITRGVLVTIEDEREYSARHFPRNYKRIFERLGMTQMESITPVADLSDAFVARVFRA